MDNDFYKAFEDKHRGSRELIKSRLKSYLPFVQPIKDVYKHCQAIDLGCGRGEWLELLTDEGGFDVHGVDLDKGMLDVCEKHGLQHSQQDALTCLNSLADESQILVTGFHLAEHIPFADLQELVKQALRVLKPAGLLILETPNPENITVGTVDFYMDPTHENPLPPYLLKFLPNYYGFQQTKIIRLQEDSALISNSKITLTEVLKGVSPDYAIIAQKGAEETLMAKFSSVFAKEFGVTLELLAGNYDRQTKAKEERVEVMIARLEINIQKVEERAQQAEERAQQAERQLAQLLGSKSWQYTQPIRQCLALFQRLIK